MIKFRDTISGGSDLDTTAPQRMPNFKVDTKAMIATHEGLVIPGEYIDVATLAFKSLYSRYGRKNSSTYKSYHNHEHSFNVAADTLNVLDIMDEMGLPIQPIDHAVGLLNGSLHDIEVDAVKNGVIQTGVTTIPFRKDLVVQVENDGTKNNEHMSAEIAIRLLDRLNFRRDISSRVGKGILMTEVEFRNGQVLQINAGKGGHDYAAIAVAIADTASDAFRGRLTRSVARLVAENPGGDMNDVTFVTERTLKFAAIQHSFFNQRIAELHGQFNALSDDPEAVKVSQKRIQRAFEPHIDRALGVVARIDDALTQATKFRKLIAGTLNDLRNSPMQQSEKIQIAIDQSLDQLNPQVEQ